MDREATSGGILLEVHEAPQDDVGLGRARVDTETRAALRVNPGDVLKLIGKRTTPAVAVRLKGGDEGKGMIRIDGLLRRNLGISVGEVIEVQKADILPAQRLTIAPILAEGHMISFGEGLETFVKRGLLNRCLNRGDAIIVPGIALMGGALPFVVIGTEPKGIVQVQQDTILTLQREAVREWASARDVDQMFLESLEAVLAAYGDRLDHVEGEAGARATKLRDEVRRLLDDARRSGQADREADRR